MNLALQSSIWMTTSTSDMRVRKEGSEAEEFRFVRGATGKVTSVVHFSNPTPMESSLADERHRSLRLPSLLA